MRKIIAIGGGEIGRPGYGVETTAIDKEILSLTGKIKPLLLFLPTASSDADLYVETVHKHFGRSLGCEVDELFLLKEKYTEREISDKIMRADAIYVGGGNTLLMMKIWRKYGVDRLLVKAWKRGTVMAGLSAGSICWFRDGLSDSIRAYGRANSSFIKVRGLGLIPALHSPHYDIERERHEGLKVMMKRTPGVGIAIDNCAALEVIDGRYRLITSNPRAKAYTTFWKEGLYYEMEIRQSAELKPISQLLKK